MRTLTRLAFFAFCCTLIFKGFTNFYSAATQCSDSVGAAYFAIDPEKPVKAGCDAVMRKGKVADVYADAIYEQLKK